MLEDDGFCQSTFYRCRSTANINFFREWLCVFGFGINAFDFSSISRLTDLIINHNKDLYFPGRKTSDCVVLDCKDWYRHGLYAYAVNIAAKDKYLSMSRINWMLEWRYQLIYFYNIWKRKIERNNYFSASCRGWCYDGYTWKNEALMQTDHHVKMSNLLWKFDH